HYHRRRYHTVLRWSVGCEQLYRDRSRTGGSGYQAVGQGTALLLAPLTDELVGGQRGGHGVCERTPAHEGAGPEDAGVGAPEPGRLRVQRRVAKRQGATGAVPNRGRLYWMGA